MTTTRDFVEPVWITLEKAGYKQLARHVHAKILASQIKKREEKS